MSFIFSRVNGSSIGETPAEVGAGTFYETAFSQGFHESMLNSLYRLSEYQQTQEEDPFWNPRIKKEEANHYAQQQGVSDLRFDSDPTQDEMSLLIRRKIEQRDRQQILEAGSSGTDRMVGRIGTQFLGSVLNPLDLPLMFLPVVGSGTKAAQVEGRIASAFTRGLITEEALAARGIALKGYTAALLEGSVGQAITEIPLFFANAQDQTDYSATDFFTNVALGGLFGVGVNTLRLGFRSALKLHSKLSPETRENMMTGAMDDFLRGESINPTRFVDLDDGVVRSEANKDVGLQVRTAAGEIVELRKSEVLEDEVLPGLNVKQLQDLPEATAEEALQKIDTIKQTFDDWVEGFRNQELEGRYEVELDPKSFSEFAEEGVQYKLVVDPFNGGAHIRVTKPDGGGAVIKIGPSDISKGKINPISEMEYVPSVNEKIVEATPEKIVQKGNQSVKSFQEKEKIASQNKQQKLEEEVKAGQTIPEKQIVAHGELPDEAEFARIEEEISHLNEINRKDLDAMEGNVASTINMKDVSKRVIPFEREYTTTEWGRYLAEADMEDIPEYKAFELVDAIKAGLAPNAAKLFDELFEIDPSLRDVSVSFDEMLAIDKGAAGVYNGGGDYIVLNGSVAPKTLFHELVHASAVRRWRQDLTNNAYSHLPAFKGKDYLRNLELYIQRTENKALKNLVDSYLNTISHYQTHIDPAGKIENFINRDSDTFFESDLAYPHYGLLNFDEFIAEAISNRQFQLFLNGIPGRTERTVFGDFIRAIKDFFGLAERPNTMLNDVLDDFQKLTQSGERAPDGFLKGLQRADSSDISKDMISKASNCVLNAAT